MKVVRLSTTRTCRLYPRKCSRYSFSLGAESTPGPWYGRKEYITEKSSYTTGNRSRNRQLVAQRLNHYATPGPIFSHSMKKNQVLKTLLSPKPKVMPAYKWCHNPVIAIFLYCTACNFLLFSIHYNYLRQTNHMLSLQPGWQ
jgi:hypothetical protein